MCFHVLPPKNNLQLLAKATLALTFQTNSETCLSTVHIIVCTNIHYKLPPKTDKSCSQSNSAKFNIVCIITDHSHSVHHKSSECTMVLSMAMRDNRFVPYFPTFHECFIRNLPPPKFTYTTQPPQYLCLL
jgi:hypothetical protein